MNRHRIHGKHAAVSALIALTLATVGACVGDGRVAAKPLPDAITQVLNQPRYRSAAWSLRVVDVDNGEVVHDLRSDRPMLVGSVRKLFSVGLALDALGPEHVFRTPVHRRGTVDAAGILTGDLIVVASGDLTMGGRTNPDGSLAVSDYDHNEANALGNAVLTAPDPLAGFRRLAAQVAASGIKHVSGNVIIDDRLFEPFDFRGEFQVRPIFVNDNVVDAVVSSAAGCAGFDWRPKSTAFSVQCGISSIAAGGAFKIEAVPELPSCIGSAGCGGRVEGTLPADVQPPLTGQFPIVRTFRIVQPANYARTVFIEALADVGVSVGSPAVAPNPPGPLPARSTYSVDTRVAELVSSPFREYVQYVMKVSYNLGADMCLMLFGLTKGTTTLAGALTAESGALAIQFGINPGQLHFVDGSGGGDTTATGTAVTSLLQAMSRRPSFAVFRDAQPSLGIDGSLAFVNDFAADPALAGAKGRVHAKTGTYVVGSAAGPVLKAQALAGYIDARSGRHLAFTLTVNDVGLISGVDEILPVFQDQGKVAAILWKSH